MINFKEQFKQWRFLRSWRPYFVIITLGFLLYSQSLFFNLTYLDDNTLLLDNREIISDIKNIPLAFSSDVFFSGTNFYYRPILNLSFMLDTLFAGDNFFIYFLVNIFLHLGVTCLVFLILKKIITRKSLAFFLSLIFLVHPAISQAVAWLPGRNDSLLALFSLLAICFLFQFNARPKLRFLILYTFFFFIALLTKETAVFLPLLVVVYFFTTGRQQVAEKWEKFLVILMSFFAGVIWFLMRNLAFGTENISLGEAFRSLGDNLSGAVILASKAILPFNLSVLPVLADSSFLWSILAIPLIVVVLVLSRRRNFNKWAFGLAWFLIFLLPPFIISTAAPYILEHRLYLPLVGLLIMLAEIDWLKNIDFSQRKTRLIAAGVLLILMAITFFHSAKFRNRLVFWESAVQNSPHSPLAQKNLGAMYYLEGQPDKALPHYLEALQLNPQEKMVNNNIGLIYGQKGDRVAAEKFFQQELAMYPDYDRALFNLGFLYYQQEKIGEAQSLFQATLRSNPRHYEAWHYLQESYKQKIKD